VFPTASSSFPRIHTPKFILSLSFQTFGLMQCYPQPSTSFPKQQEKFASQPNTHRKQKHTTPLHCLLILHYGHHHLGKEENTRKQLSSLQHKVDNNFFKP
jgi:hypothetical protein